MADKDKLRFLTGQEDNLGEKTVTRGQVYFAINSDKESGKIYFDAPIDATTTKRILMSSDHAATADSATSADRATNDSNGKKITETYVSEIKLDDAGTSILYKYPDISTWKTLSPKFLPLTGGTITGELYADSITAGDLLVNGSARFINTIQGNIETANKWKTARGFQIADAGAAHTGASVSVDGSGNVVLKLPDTIEATLIGHADTATHATYADYPTGFKLRGSSWNNTHLTTENGYTQVTIWGTTGSTDNTSGYVCFADKDNQISMGVDGFFYQNEGKYLVLDENNFNDYAPKLDGTGATGTWNITASKATQDVNGNNFIDTYLTNIFVKTDTNDLYKTIGTSGDSDKTIKIGTFAPLDSDGLINIKYIPAAALERVVVVADDTARKALTTASVQLGDVVKVTGTGQMYFVVDTAKLNDDAGYVQFSAGAAAEVKWSGIINRPNIVARSTGNAIVPNAANTEFTVFQINGDSSDTSYVIKPNFLPKTGGTITGELYVDGGTTLASLLVTGAARLLNGLNINGDLTIAGNLLPATTNAYTVGDSTHQWLQTQTKLLSVGAGDISSTGYEAVISGDLHVTGNSLFDDYVQIGGARPASTSYKLYVNGLSYFTNPIYIGSDINGSGKNYIAFYGTTGDNPGGFNHGYIGENIWGTTGCSELVLFKGNDIATQAHTAANPGADRIRSIAAGHLFQVYEAALSGTFSTICASTVPINRFEINRYGTLTWGDYLQTIDGDATIKIYANTNTTYGNESVAIQTAYDATDPETGGYPASSPARCNLLLQPKGGQVYIGSDLTTVGDTSYKLYVNGNSFLRGNNFLYGDLSALYDSADQYLKYTVEGTVANHAAKISLYRITASGTAGTAGTTTEGIQFDAKNGYVYTNGSTTNGSLKTSLGTSTHLAGNQGRAIINSKASAGYNMLYRMKSTNGVFTGGAYNTAFNVYYTADSTISASTNTVTKGITLIDESGNLFPNATNSQTLGISRDRWKAVYIGTADTYGSGLKPIYWNAGVPTVSTDTEGSATKGIYLNAGTISPMTYSLRATVNSGAANRMAYYSGANAISATSHYTSTTKVAINSTSKPSHNLYINGTTYFNGASYIGGGNMYIGAGGAGGYLNSGATHGGCNSIKIGDDVWLGDVNQSGIMGMTSTGANTGFWLYNSSGTCTGKLYSNATSGLVTATHFIPESNNTQDLGDSSHYWSNLYVNTINGNLTVTAKNADKLDGYHFSDLESRYVNVSGDTMTGVLYTPSIASSNACYIAFPSGARYDTTTSSVTGAFKITLPTYAACTMMRFYVDIYNYNGEGAITYLISGYPYTDASWHNYTAQAIGTSSTTTHSNLKVRFGNDGSKNCIWIGETSTTWSYPHVQVRDFMGGHSTTASSSWASGWSITLVTAFDTVTQTISTVNELTMTKVYGAVWNDYAEYRNTLHQVQAGRCVCECGDGSLKESNQRLLPGANIVSDTFGFAIGETEKTKTPLAVSGRVLAYPNEDRYSYKPGDPVCSGPNGTISKMTREEVREYPERIVGTVSEIPEYFTWGTGNVKVDGRIWIKVR